MGNWLNTEGLERGIRYSFLINRKPTEVEIQELKESFRQIEQAATTIETLIRELRSSGSKSDIKRQIEDETLRLFTIYEFLEEMIRGNKNLKDRFLFDIAKVRKQIDKFIQ